MHLFNSLITFYSSHSKNFLKLTVLKQIEPLSFYIFFTLKERYKVKLVKLSPKHRNNVKRGKNNVDTV